MLRDLNNLVIEYDMLLHNIRIIGKMIKFDDLFVFDCLYVYIIILLLLSLLPSLFVMSMIYVNIFGRTLHCKEDFQ